MERTMHRLMQRSLAATSAAVALIPAPAWAQDPGIVRGTVALVENGGAIHGAVVLLVGPGLVALTDERGEFEIENVPAGTYEILAQREHLSSARQIIAVESEATTAVEFELVLSPVHEEVTVTATTGGRTTTFEAFNATTTLDSFDIIENPSWDTERAREPAGYRQARILAWPTMRSRSSKAPSASARRSTIGPMLFASI